MEVLWNVLLKENSHCEFVKDGHSLEIVCSYINDSSITDKQLHQRKLTFCEI